MVFVAGQIAVWIVIAFIIGALVGWFARGRRGTSSSGRRRSSSGRRSGP